MSNYRIKSSAVATKPGRAVMNTLTICLCMDYWNAPEWLWGVVVTFLVIAWIGVLYAIYKEETIDPFEKPKSGVIKSGFQQRLEELANKNK